MVGIIKINIPINYVDSIFFEQINKNLTSSIFVHKLVKVKVNPVPQNLDNKVQKEDQLENRNV